MTTPNWVEEARSWQPLSKHKSFTKATSDDTVTTVFTVQGNAEYFTKISFVVEDNDLYVEFDGDAGSTTMLIPAGEGYSDENVYIGTKMTIINATAGQNGKIRGIAWGR